LIDYHQALYIHGNTVNPLAGTALANVFSITTSFDGDVNLAASPPSWAFSAGASTTLFGATLTGSLGISSSSGLVVNVSQHASGSGGGSAFGYSYSEYFDLTAGINTSGVAYYQANADISGNYTFLWIPGSFNDPYSSSGQVNLGQLVQTLESGVLGVWNDIEGIINWLENNF
jgi:hypothetical protein